MATRYSGQCRITVTWIDNANMYRAGVTWPDGDRTRGDSHRIGRPPGSRLAVDSPEAYDQAAHAALSFTAEGVPDLPAASTVNGSGWHVGRRASQAWPELPPCARTMACLCAAHARGRAAGEPCDANEGSQP